MTFSLPCCCSIDWAIWRWQTMIQHNSSLKDQMTMKHTNHAKVDCNRLVWIPFAVILVLVFYTYNTIHNTSIIYIYIYIYIIYNIYMYIYIIYHYIIYKYIYIYIYMYICIYVYIYIYIYMLNVVKGTGTSYKAIFPV